MSGNSTILIAYGDAENLVLLQTQLEQNDYYTITAASGDEALDAVSHNNIDLIIIDVALQGKDAFEITRALKAEDHTRIIPVILAVSLMAEAERAKGVKAGCDDFINKPPDSFEIMTRVRSLLKVKAYHDHMLNNTITRHETIAARIEIEQRLRENEEKLRFIFNSIADGISVIDLATGRIVDTNDAALRMFNFEREVVIGMPAFELVAEKDRQRAIEDSINTIATGDSGVAEWCLLGKDGTEHDCEARAGIIYDRSGKPLYMVNVMRDIGERKRITEAIKESERRYRILAENVSDAIFTLDMNLRFTYISSSASRITAMKDLGLTDGKLIGKAVQDVVTPESFLKLCKVLGSELVLEVSGEAHPFRSRVLELQLMTKDKSVFWVEARGSFLRDDKGHVTGILGIMRDVTQEKRDAEAKAAIERKAQINSRLASIGEMAAGIAHEINNPLTPIVGLADMLLKEDHSETVKADLITIRNCASQANDVIKRLLAFARQAEPMRSSCNINDIVENTLHILDHGLKKNNITYVTKLDFGLPETIADKAQIQQVVLNIIVNAQQAITGFRGRGNILIQTKHEDDLVKIFVKDDGPGISTDTMERIFDPFFTTKNSGTGLGLSICHGIIAEHNGRIYIESEDGKGATFIVELPVIKHELEEKVKPLILPDPMIQRKE